MSPPLDRPPEPSTPSSGGEPGRRLELPQVAQALSLLRGLPASSSVDPALKREGERLARRRALFLAAEAAGQLPAQDTVGLRELLVDNLADLLRHGTTLHKVRALRAVQLIPSERCLPYLEGALRDPSAWVSATALRTLLRLDLRAWNSRGAAARFLLRSFAETLWPRQGRTRSFAYIVRAFVLGVIKGRAGWLLAALACLLLAVHFAFRVIFFAAVWILPFLALGFAVAALSPLYRFVQPAVETGMDVGARLLRGLLLLVAAVAFPWASWRTRQPTNRIRVLARLVLGSALDYGLLALLWSRIPEVILPGWPAAIFMGLIAGSTLQGKPQSAGRQQWAARTAAFLYLTFQVPFFSLPLLLLSAAAMLSVLGLARSWLTGSSIARQIGLSLLLLVGVSLLVLLLASFELVFELAFILLLCLGLPLGFYALREKPVPGLRALLLSRRLQRFRSQADFVEHAIGVVRSPTYPLLVRTSTALALVRAPLADARLLERLMDLAEEDLPPEVRDALYQAVDAAETRVRRGQVGRSQVGTRPGSADPSPFSVPTPLPGRDLLKVAATVALMAALLGAIHLAGSGPGALPDVAWLAQLWGGAGLLLAAAASRAQSFTRRWAFLIGGGWLSLAFFHGLQARVVSTVDVEAIDSTFFREPLLVDWPTFSACVAALWVFYVGAVAGHVLLRLDTDTTLPSSRREAPILLAVALVSISLSSVPLQELGFVYREEPPRFVALSPDQAIVERLPLGRRVVRIALIEVPPGPRLPRLSLTFPRPGGWQIGGKWTRKQHFLADDPVCKGEVWLLLGAEPWGGSIWLDGCLHLAALTPQRAVLRIESSICPPSPERRLVAVVYSRLRSSAVTEDVKRATTAKELARRNDLPEIVLSTANLEQTITASARGVWSPPLSQR